MSADERETGVVADPRCNCPCHTGMATHVAPCKCERALYQAEHDDGPGFRWGIRERALLAEVRLWQRLGLPDPPPLLGRLADTLESAAAAVGAERVRAEAAEAAIAAARGHLDNALGNLNDRGFGRAERDIERALAALDPEATA